jgi:SAM-dependent methyltransferase
VTVETRRALASVWTDAEVAGLYRYRPPYPPAVFDVLRRLTVARPVVLDAGCGTGAITFGLTAFASRIEAIDPSAAMIAEARHLPGADDPRIQWAVAAAETAELHPPYDLITCGRSLHWMDHDVVMPRFHDALAPGGRLALIDDEPELPPALREKLFAIFDRLSGKKPSAISDMFADLERRRLFERQGFQRTSTILFEQSVDDYIRALGSTSSLSRVTLGDRVDDLAAEVRALFASLGLDRVCFPVAGNVVWGRPLRSPAGTATEPSYR